MTDIISENKRYWTQRAVSYSEVNKTELGGNKREGWKDILCENIFRGSKKDSKEIKVLEIGTGPGFFAILMAEAGFSVTAIDLTPNMLKEARENAKGLEKKIDFMEMNAEELSFDDDTFDVIISRNLTWNLPNPEKAYKEWCRVLKQGGKIINFDANWYGYLYDEEAKAAYEQDRKNTNDMGFMDYNIGENFDVMEKIAKKIPLSAIRRPDWDKKFLSSIGMRVETDENIWKKAWSDEEKINFASTPMFLVYAEK